MTNADSEKKTRPVIDILDPEIISILQREIDRYRATQDPPTLEWCAEWLVGHYTDPHRCRVSESSSRVGGGEWPHCPDGWDVIRSVDFLAATNISFAWMTRHSRARRDAEDAQKPVVMSLFDEPPPKVVLRGRSSSKRRERSILPGHLASAC